MIAPIRSICQRVGLIRICLQQLGREKNHDPWNLYIAKKFILFGWQQIEKKQKNNPPKSLGFKRVSMAILGKNETKPKRGQKKKRTSQSEVRVLGAASCCCAD
jgi:hypothetical protein